MRRLVPLLIAAVLSSPATARADGLPVGGIDASLSGVANADSRYVTMSTDGRTFVARIDTKTAKVREWRRLYGEFTIPAVAQDGSADGLSHDGRTLVLIRPRVTFPQTRTHFAILDAGVAGPFRLRRKLVLKGDFSFDALSPDGRTLYLIHYISKRDPWRYRVRSYDLVADRMHPGAIVPEHDAPDDMNGYPLSRVASPDGRWAYTLYDRPEGTPFIHALDTVDRHAHCIDVPDAAGLMPGLTLAIDRAGRKVSVLDEGDAVATLDTRTFGTSVPPYEPPAAARTTALSQPDDEPWALLVAPAGLLVAAAAFTARARRRRAPRTASE